MLLQGSSWFEHQEWEGHLHGKVCKNLQIATRGVLWCSKVPQGKSIYKNFGTHVC